MITLIFLASYEETNLIPTLKEAFITYFGTRNIENRYDEFPILVVKELTVDDRTAITSAVERLNSQSVQVIISEKKLNNDYIVDL